MRAATRGLGQGALLAHAFLPVEGHAVPGREGQPETRGGMTSQNPRCAPSPPPGPHRPRAPGPSARTAESVPAVGPRASPCHPRPRALVRTGRQGAGEPRGVGVGVPRCVSAADCLPRGLPPAPSPTRHALHLCQPSWWPCDGVSQGPALATDGAQLVPAVRGPLACIFCENRLNSFARFLTGFSFFFFF